MEAVIWLVAAVVVYFAGNRMLQKHPDYTCNTAENLWKKKKYIKISCLSALLCELIIKAILRMHHLSVWMILTYAVIAVQCSVMFWMMDFAPIKWKDIGVMAIKMMIGMLILAFYYVSLSKRVFGESKIADQFSPVNAGMADVMIILSTALWIYGADLAKRFQEVSKALYWMLLATTPILIFLIVEFGWNSSLTGISLLNAELNILIYMMLEIVFISLAPQKLIGLQLLYVFAWLLGALNYYLVRFRGQPFLATDIHAIRTAISVAGQYTFEIAEGLAFTFLVLYFLLTFMRALGKIDLVKKKTGKKSALTRCVGGFAAVAMLTFWIGNYDFPDTYHIGVDFWWQANTYRASGFAPAFISFWQRMKISKPDGYTEQKSEAILEEYGNNLKDTENTTPEDFVQPTIITIMNESFSDLSVLGPLTCTDNDLKFLHSLKDDPGTVEYGWNYVSTRGGGTSTTEFEYLTGNSMVYTNGINPYSSFDFTNVPSMVSLLKEQGYRTIAMHPENKENWRRSVVYSKLGFDDFLSIDSYEDSERTVWDRVSDFGDYQKLIDIYEEQTEPSFIFNITMQNHGGYDSLSELQPEEIVNIDESYSGYTDVQMYESLIAKSDAALAYLISYFKNVDKPVLICFFGDHQPSLNADFENTMKKSGREQIDTDLAVTQKTYAVPYFIWSNYDISEDYSKKNTVGEDVISTNYLGTLVQKYAGLQLSAYDKFRMNQREKVPVLNIAGYMRSDGTWCDLWSENQISEWLERYQNVQYYALFDKKKAKRFFSISIENDTKR